MAESLLSKYAQSVNPVYKEEVEGKKLANAYQKAATGGLIVPDTWQTIQNLMSQGDPHMSALAGNITQNFYEDKPASLREREALPDKTWKALNKIGPDHKEPIKIVDDKGYARYVIPITDPITGDVTYSYGDQAYVTPQKIAMGGGMEALQTPTNRVSPSSSYSAPQGGPGTTLPGQQRTGSYAAEARPTAVPREGSIEGRRPTPKEQIQNTSVNSIGESTEDAFMRRQARSEYGKVEAKKSAERAAIREANFKPSTIQLADQYRSVRNMSEIIHKSTFLLKQNKGFAAGWSRKSLPGMYKGGEEGMADLASFGGTAANDLHQTLKTLKSKVVLDELKALKKLSSQGATGFGALSDRELRLLEASIASLDESQSWESLHDNLTKVDRHYKELLRKMEIEHRLMYDDPKDRATMDRVYKEMGVPKYKEEIEKLKPTPWRTGF